VLTALIPADDLDPLLPSTATNLGAVAVTTIQRLVIEAMTDLVESVRRQPTSIDTFLARTT